MVIEELARAAPAAGTRQPAWTIAAVLDLYALPFMDLMHQAQQTHRLHHDPNRIELASLLSIKTGGCPEDCAYCPQSRRFCMGAAWRSPTARQLDSVARLVAEVKALGLETCVTLGMLKPGQAEQLRDAGLDYYNHNLDTSPEFYGNVITTRRYQDRLDTLGRVQAAGLKVCCGGILGMGESRRDRAGLIAQLANLSPYPESVPINQLVKVPGTPLDGAPDIDAFEFVRTVAVARITMPRAAVRLSAGREAMDDTMQALCFLAGANSIFHGDQLLTTPNPQTARDAGLFERLGLTTGA